MNKNIQRMLFVLIIAILIILFYVFKLDKYFTYKNVLEVKNFIINLSFLGPLIIIVFFVGLNLIGMPNVFFVFLSGYLYGFYYGFILGYIGTILGFTFSFISVRYFFQDLFLKKYGKNKLVLKIEEYTEKYKAWSILFFRVVFAIPYSIQNIAYALTKINFLIYFIFSLIGCIPQTLIFVLLGYLLSSGRINLAQFKNIFFVIVVIITVISSVYFTYLLIKSKIKKV
ncbi:MAG: VTT domain-containing protein [Spirochaetes bacterium]|nr:VTT domain-containing protein [Spirochaetota bacterium]